MDMNLFRLIPDNPLLYTAVDSGYFIQKGTGLVDMKLEAHIVKGYFISVFLQN